MAVKSTFVLQVHVEEFLVILRGTWRESNHFLDVEFGYGVPSSGLWRFHRTLTVSQPFEFVIDVEFLLEIWERAFLDRWRVPLNSVERTGVFSENSSLPEETLERDQGQLRGNVAADG